MFERLLTLPLFQGMTLKELSEVLTHVRLDFVKYQKGDEIVSQNDPCRNLVCIINGDISSTFREETGKFTLFEKLSRVSILEPYNMFGMYPRYSRDYTFESEGETLTIERNVFINHVLNNNIVKINMMNIISNRYQQTLRSLYRQENKSVTAKIIRFLQTYSSIQKGEKELSIRMVTLADYVEETRLNVSYALNALQDQGLLKLCRGMILIPALEDLK